MATRQVFVELSHQATAWYFGLSMPRRLIVDERLRDLAFDPERAAHREEAPGGPIYTAFVRVDDGEVWGYRVDFYVDELIRARARIPHIAVLKARTLPYRR